MKVYPIRQEEVIHGLFGGKETKPILHSVYTVEISDLDNNFICKFEILSEKKICGFVPKINDPEILQVLDKRKIKIFDSFYSGNESDLLIGADVIGKILCGGDCVELTPGLTAVKTNLGWTVIGKPKETLNDSYCKDNVLVVLSLHVSNNSLRELWNLEVLGITDPLEDTSRKNLENENIIDFQNKLRVLFDGRYQLELPWKCESFNLSDNKNLALMRHKKMMKRVKDNKYLNEYQEIFREWENLNIIEQVPEQELSYKGHFLPHRPD
ncbi:DUF1758 domain-containing protein [Trichonephila clavipes]|nr:DUF1758 domain-containing protein [Trichonephila clavipes]